MAKLMDLRRKMAAHKNRNETTTMIIEKAYEKVKKELRGRDEQELDELTCT
jgi:hypothetical protein